LTVRPGRKRVLGLAMEFRLRRSSMRSAVEESLGALPCDHRQLEHDSDETQEQKHLPESCAVIQSEGSLPYGSHRRQVRNVGNADPAR